MKQNHTSTQTSRCSTLTAFVGSVLTAMGGLGFLSFAPSSACAVDCSAPPMGLVSFWPGEGTASDLASDNNGTLMNGVAFVPGKAGQAFSFNGTTGYIRVPDSPNLRFTSAMTIEGWVYPASVGGAYRNIISKWDYPSATSQVSYTTAINADGKFGFGLCNDGKCPSSSSGTVLSSSSPPVNQWTHFAATYDGAVMRMYVNGFLEGQAPYTGGIFPGTNSLIIGAALPGLSHFSGRIDEPAVYNRALSETEIQAIYSAGSGGKCHRPIITTQPRNQLGYWGQSITLSAAALGATPMSYQWLHNGSPKAGGSDGSLVLTNVQADDAGTYCVVITNTYGSATSSNALVTVNPAGVSADLYTGITIEGVVGQTYGVQYTTNLDDAGSWQGLANVPLSTTPQLWVDAQPANQARRYYRVVPGPISIP